MTALVKTVEYLREHDFLRLVAELLFLAGIAAIYCYGNRAASLEETVRTCYGVPS